MEKLHIRKIASLGLMLCFFTGEEHRHLSKWKKGKSINRIL